MGSIAFLAAKLLGSLSVVQSSFPEADGRVHSGFAWADCNGDRLADALVIAPAGRARLVLSASDGSLRDATVEWGLGDDLAASFALWEDIDRDGAPDLLIGTPAGRLRLFLLRGTCFEERSEAVGLATEGGVTHAGFLDYDQDALPDLHLCTASASTLHRNLGVGDFELVVSVPSLPAAAPRSAWEATDLDPAVRAEPERAGAARSAQPGALARPSFPLAATSAAGGAPGSSSATAFPACATALRDQASGGCLFASSVPELGALYPLGPELFVDAATGFVGIGTTAPVERLTVAGELALLSTGGGKGFLAQAGAGFLGGQLFLTNGNNVTTFQLLGHGFPLGASHFQLRSAVGQNRIDLDGGNDDGGGDLSLYAADDSRTLFLDANDASAAGCIQLGNDAGATTVELAGDGADDGGLVQLRSSAGTTTILLDGEDGTGGLIGLHNDAGVRTLALDGDSGADGRITVTNQLGVTTALLDGGTNANGGELTLFAADGSVSLLMDASDGELGGHLYVSNDSGETAIELDGDDGQDAGALRVWNRNGATSDTSLVLHARDAIGTGSELLMTDAQGNLTIDLDGSNGGVGQLRILEDDGSVAFDFSSSTLSLRDATGAATITFNRITGAKNAVVELPGAGQRLFYCQESPEVWFEDFGSARLEGGRAQVELDPLFLQAVTVDAEHPLKVFITMNGPSGPVWVEKGSDRFTVRESGAGRSNAPFDWRVVAKRRGLENHRLEPFQDGAEAPGCDPRPSSR